jgi:predicted Zn finger-like uncharacterized protein
MIKVSVNVERADHMLEKPLKCPNCGTHFFVDEVLNVQEHPKEAMPVECPNCHHIYEKRITNGYFMTFEDREHGKYEEEAGE